MKFCQFCGVYLGASGGGNACAGCWAAVRSGAAPQFSTSTGEPLASLADRWAAELAEANQRDEKATADPALVFPTIPANATTWTFVVPGQPVGGVRQTRRDKFNPSEAVKRYRAWRDLARAHAGPVPPPETVIDVSWVAYLRPPKTRKVGGKTKHFNEAERLKLVGVRAWTKPDRDNIDKALLDALWPEDSDITSGRIHKEFSFVPRLVVQITAEGQASG